MLTAVPCKGAREILPPRGRVSSGTQTFSPLLNGRVTWRGILHPWDKPPKDSQIDRALTSENAALTSRPKVADIRLCNEGQTTDYMTSLSPLTSSTTSNTEVKLNAVATIFADRYTLNKNIAASNRAVSTTRQAAHDSSDAISQVAEEPRESHPDVIVQLPDDRKLEKRVPEAEARQNIRVIPRMGTRAYRRRQCLDPGGRGGGGGNVELQRVVGTSLFHEGKEPDPEEVDTSTSSAYNTGCTASDSSELENRLEVSLEISSKKCFETTTNSPTNFDESLLERGTAKRHENLLKNCHEDMTPNAENTSGVRGNDEFGPNLSTTGRLPESKSSAKKASDFFIGSESNRFSSNQKRYRRHVTGTAPRDRSAEVTCVDVIMYTNRANLEHTMLVQQCLLYEQQQLLRRANCPERLGAAGQPHRVEKGRIQSGRTAAGNIIKGNADPEEVGLPMEWVVRKRSDGTRYIAKRPLSAFKVTRRHQQTHSRGITVGFTSSDDDVDGDVKPRRHCRRENVEVTRSRQKKNGEMSRRMRVLTDGGRCNAFDATNTTQETHFNGNENSTLGCCLDSGQRCNRDNVDGNGNRALLSVATF